METAGLGQREADELRGSARETAALLSTQNYKAGEFAHFHREIRLRNGLNLRLRHLQRRDRLRLKEFFARCSVEAIRDRFMSSIDPASDSLLNCLAEPDGSSHVALIVTQGLGTDERVVAEGRFVVFNERREIADVALLVVDEFQRQGIGTMLIHQLIEIACRKGVTRFSADVLLGNRAILSLLRGTSQCLSATVSYGSIHFEIPITETLPHVYGKIMTSRSCPDYLPRR
jgi:GNAT superfamily N-acetyltransferase